MFHISNPEFDFQILVQDESGIWVSGHMTQFQRGFSWRTDGQTVDNNRFYNTLITQICKKSSFF